MTIGFDDRMEKMYTLGPRFLEALDELASALTKSVGKTNKDDTMTRTNTNTNSTAGTTGGKEKKEAVNHPSWYGSKDDPYETIKVIEAWGLNFTLGNALKYISRAGKKDPSKTVEDLRKALFYIQYEIDRIEGLN